MQSLQEVQVARCCTELSTLPATHRATDWIGIERAALIVVRLELMGEG